MAARSFTQISSSHLRGRHGGVEKGGGWKTSRMTPLPKRGFGPPLVRYVFHPSQASALCSSCTKIHDRADQNLFWRGPKIFGRARSLVRFPPPIRFAPPHITAQTSASGPQIPHGLNPNSFTTILWELRGPRIALLSWRIWAPQIPSN